MKMSYYLRNKKLLNFRLIQHFDSDAKMAIVVNQFPGLRAHRRPSWDPRETGNNKQYCLVLLPRGLIREQTHFNCVHANRKAHDIIVRRRTEIIKAGRGLLLKDCLSCSNLKCPEQGFVTNGRKGAKTKSQTCLFGITKQL